MTKKKALGEPRAALIVRLPRSLYQRLKQGAQATGLSLNSYCSRLLGATPLPEQSPPAYPAPLLSSIPELQRLAADLLEEFGVELEAVVLFGSWARGHATASSDLDLLVVFTTGTQIDRDRYDRLRPRKVSGHEVSPLFVELPASSDEPRGIWLEAAMEGIVILDLNLKVSRYLAEVRGHVAGGRVRRMFAHGHPYWVHESASYGRNLQEDEHREK